ncbi:hypothetical protein FHS37_007305 [Streptomyces griseostramineus]|uniref:Uncharacterized protein n=1 Tax=Streptomyces griseomycini TaxID=66895 RepID=A0A7W7VAJ8_9ACTN|nr:hypothetical protein [Streptomyces griseomycini]
MGEAPESQLVVGDVDADLFGELAGGVPAQ